MAWQNLQQRKPQPVKLQPRPIAAAQQAVPKKHTFIKGLIKFIIIIAFFIGAYYALNKLGIIQKVIEGFLLLRRI